jgi:peptidoglycan/xylan/chitin deacetylase (PgdA/CDA1 family)
MPQDVTLSKGVFIFSLDTEIAWGTHGNRRYAFEYDHVREVIHRLLALCEQYEISITWAIVGQLMVAGDHPWWHAPDVVAAIRACTVAQEIGSHSFEHRLDEPSCTASEMEADLQAARAVADAQGIALRSFVFPKNRVKHLDVLERNGFVSYRGANQSWYEALPRPARRIAHVIDDYMVPSAPTVLPERIGGLWNIPGSYFYVHRRGWASVLPINFRVRKVRAGLHDAAARRRVFHLWCHPFNLASDPDGLLRGIEQIFQEVSRLREAGTLDQMTMEQFRSTLPIL